MNSQYLTSIIYTNINYISIKCIYYFYYYYRFQKFRHNSSTLMYSFCFLLYGIMMTNAMLTDSILNQAPATCSFCNSCMHFILFIFYQLLFYISLSSHVFESLHLLSIYYSLVYLLKI